MGCSSEILLIVSMLSVPAIFYRPKVGSGGQLCSLPTGLGGVLERGRASFCVMEMEVERRGRSQFLKHCFTIFCYVDWERQKGGLDRWSSVFWKFARGSFVFQYGCT
jgi:hypothetical protein